MLEAGGFTDIDPDKWYPQQYELDMFNTIESELTGDSLFDFVSVGMVIIDNAVLPPKVEQITYPEIEFMWNDIFKLNHRGKNAGEISVEQIDAHHIKITAMTPYPHNFNYGLHYGVARRFLPVDVPFTIYFDSSVDPFDTTPPTVLHVEWELPSGSQHGAGQ